MKLKYDSELLFISQFFKLHLKHNSRYFIYLFEQNKKTNLKCFISNCFINIIQQNVDQYTNSNDILKPYKCFKLSRFVDIMSLLCISRDVMKCIKSTKFYGHKTVKLYFLILSTFAFFNFPSKTPLKGSYQAFCKFANHL